MDLKPTNTAPVGDISKKYTSDFNSEMNASNVNLQETDNLLTEKEQSLKKKIFSLAKMEALVFSDPKLTSVYDEMSDNGEEKYGYHYNETIMNMIFNDYVLNSPKYLQKYKMAIPKKKKRRDKSGINQLKKSSENDFAKTEPEVTNETTGSGSSGAYATPFAWGDGDLMKGKASPITRKPIWHGGNVIQESNYLLDSTIFSEMYQQLNEDVDSYIADNANAFNNSQVKNWSNNDKNIELNTIETGTMEEKMNENNGIDNRENLEIFLSFNNDSIYWDWINGEIDDNGAIEIIRDLDGISYDPNINYREKYMGDSIDETEQSMVADMQSGTMALKPQPAGTVSNGGVPTGINDTSSMNETDTLNLFENELEAIIKYNKALMKMNEERKQSSLVLKDRIGKENKSNFKQDLNHSGTKDTIDIEKELMWNGQQETVTDPYKLGEDIENKATNKGKSFDNVGDSTNDNNKEIPKRNLTKDEQDEVNMYRLNVGDYVYDNKPSQRFEDRMKQDMGEDLYKLRQDKLKFRANAPMYNKEPQPVETTSNKKTEFNKEKTGWNDRNGINEAMITGKYFNLLGKSKIIDFKMNEVKESKENTGLFKVDLSGLGNSYYNKSIDNKVIVNEDVVKALNECEFYTNGKDVFSVAVIKKNINENTDKSIINENDDNLNKIKHLLKYQPKEYINTTSVKKERGF